METNTLYDVYEDLFDPIKTDRQARRKRKPKPRHVPKKAQQQVLAELVDETVGLEGGFETTYQPSRYEEAWLLSSIRPFYEQTLIDDVLGLVKGGKEASVYRCQAHTSTSESLMAAKVYRPRIFRSLRNDSMYRRGRAMLNANGQDHDYARDQRITRAVGKKTDFGIQVSHTSWLMHEYTAMASLLQAGAAVPRPIAVSDNAILMSYHGDGHMAAPTLNTVRLEPDEAERLFQELLRNVRLMLAHNMVHGDLSAYNILYWQGRITLIDFPQVVNLDSNPQAYSILQRDVQRICEYFARQKVNCDPSSVLEELWYEHGFGEDQLV